MTFHELTEQEKKTFNKYVLNDGTICIRKTARLQNGIFFFIMVMLNRRAKNGFTRIMRELIHHVKINQTPLKDLVAPSGRLTKTDIENAQREYIEQHQ